MAASRKWAPGNGTKSDPEMIPLSGRPNERNIRKQMVLVRFLHSEGPIWGTNSGSLLGSLFGTHTFGNWLIFNGSELQILKEMDYWIADFRLLFQFQTLQKSRFCKPVLKPCSKPGLAYKGFLKDSYSKNGRLAKMGNPEMTPKVVPKWYPFQGGRMSET